MTKINYYYDLLTGHPYNIFFPLGLSLVLVIISLWFTKKFWLTKNSQYALVWNYIKAHLIYVVLMFTFSAILAFLIKHISPFWFVGFTFYGMQVWLPIFLLIIIILAKLKNSGVFAKQFNKLSKAFQILGLVFAISVLAISYYAWFIEPFNIEITYHTFSFSDEAPKVRIVHLTDLQTDVKSSREEEVVKIVRDLRPDLIVITGDYYNGAKNSHPYGFDSARYVLENITAPHGIYCVSSDSTLHADHPILFDDLPIDYLENKNKKLSIDGQDLYLIGISRREPDTEKSFAGVPDKANKLLVYHGPEIFFDQETMDYKPDLILVGHTHGGQVALPIIGPLTSATQFGRKLAKGWFEKNGTKMYVNRGVGLEGSWAPKIRFFARPEIAVIDIE